MFGSRVVPILTAIGRSLNLLQSVSGVDERVRRIVGPERSQPNGGLFELLVAAAYRRAGATVAFRPERPGTAKTYDMDVCLSGSTLLWNAKGWRRALTESANASALGNSGDRSQMRWRTPNAARFAMSASRCRFSMSQEAIFSTRSPNGEQSRPLCYGKTISPKALSELSISGRFRKYFVTMRC